MVQKKKFLLFPLIKYFMEERASNVFNPLSKHKKKNNKKT